MEQQAVRAEAPVGFMSTEPACASAGLAKVGSEGPRGSRCHSSKGQAPGLLWFVNQSEKREAKCTCISDEAVYCARSGAGRVEDR